MTNLVQAIKTVFNTSQSIIEDPVASRYYLYGYVDALIDREDLREYLHEVVDHIVDKG